MLCFLGSKGFIGDDLADGLGLPALELGEPPLLVESTGVPLGVPLFLGD
jgi:hypothetical protein